MSQHNINHLCLNLTGNFGLKIFHNAAPGRTTGALSQDHAYEK